VEELEIESENMELEPDLDSVFCNLDQPGDAIQHSCPMEIVDTKFFYGDESFVFQSIVFDNEYKKVIIEKRDVKNKKGKYCSEVNLANMRSSQICRIHIATIDFLDDSIAFIEVENEILKELSQEIGGSFDSYATAFQSFRNSHAYHPCNHVKSIIQSPHNV
jgi:hypothetical protein